MTDNQFIEQADRIIFSSMFRAECHVAGGRFFGNVHIALGATAAGLAAGASATAFTSREIIAGSLGIAAAGVTALLTALRPDERSQLHWNAANSFAQLANKTFMSFKFGLAPEDKADHDQSEALHGSAPTSRPPLLPEAQPPHPPSPPPEETAPPDMISSQEASSVAAAPLEELVALQSDYYRLDAAGPPLPGRLSRKAEKDLVRHRAWYPPQYEEFRAWRGRITERA